MDVEEKCALLKKMSLFRDTSDTDLRAMAKDIYLRSYEKDGLLLNSDSTFHKISIVANSGRMKVFVLNPNTGEEFTIYVLSFGDIFNVITLLDGEKDYLTATSIEAIDIMHCSIDVARDWIKNYESLNKNLLKYLSKRLRLAQEYNLSKTFYSVEYRLAKLIFNNISSDDNKLNLINNLPHDEIAKMLGTTRTVVNRNLQKLKKAGMIDIERKKIIIRNYEKLEDSIHQVTIS